MAASPQTVPGSFAPPASPGNVLSSPWARLLAPSLADLFFISLIVWLFIAGGDGWKGLLLDGDCGWHIRTGEYILDHGSVPKTDLFSFTKGGQPWYAWEWLSDVLFAVLFRWAGLKAVVLMSGVVIAAYATALLRRVFDQQTNIFAALPVVLLAVGSASIHFLARPHIFTLLFLTLGVWLIERERRQPGWHIWLLVPLTVVWTNMHGGFLALILCLVGFTAGSAIETWIGAGCGWALVRRYGLLTVACAAASLINPYGVQLHVHIVEYLRSDWIRNVVQEFQSPSFRSENLMQFEVLMLLGLMVAAFSLRRKRIVEAIWMLGFTHMALGSVRHVPLFVTVAAPIIARELTGWFSKLAEGKPRKSVVAILEQMGRDRAPAFQRNSVFPVLAVLGLASVGESMNWPHDFPDLTFPRKMVAAQSTLLLHHRVFSYDQWGDYLIFANYPRQKVFIDGRSDFYGGDLGNEYLHAMQARWDWRVVLEKYRIDVVLAPAEWPLVSVLKQSKEWTLVADDGQAVLFSKKLPISTASVFVPGN